MVVAAMVLAGVVLYKFAQVGMLFARRGFNKSVAVFMGIQLIALGFALYLMAANDFTFSGFLFASLVMGIMLPSLFNLTKKQQTDKLRRKNGAAADRGDSFELVGMAEDDNWEDHSWTTESASSDWGGGSDSGGGDGGGGGGD